MKLILIVFIATVIAIIAQTGSPQAAGLGDIEINNQAKSRKEAGVGPVIFPHTLHEKYDKCATCHPKLFKKKKGANMINMGANMQGEYCGACHNGMMAYPMFHCDKCHTDVMQVK